MANTDIKENWDKMLKQGEQTEQEVLALFKRIDQAAHKVDGNFKPFDIYLPNFMVSIEVKRDMKSLETGNYFIEYEFNKQPSGIMATQSDYWLQSDTTKYLLIKTSELKLYLDFNRDTLRTTRESGDNGLCEGFLVPKGDLEQISFILALDGNNISEFENSLWTTNN